MLVKTTELCDRFIQHLQVANAIFQDYGKKRTFYGEIVTIKVFEDNSLVRSILEEQSRGRLLVVDGGGSMRCALLGDRLATVAQKNNWPGLIINGCIRDVATVAEINIGIKALSISPVSSVKHGIGERNVPVRFAGINFIPGQYLYADADGIVVSEQLLVDIL